uniref:Uncharacterized protein n=1 Tax=Candidatus Kentrum sp. LPFa TaxID=2126335 RepID=A0A450VWG6_9GAMM|nr:MAG: hypothetical protein BECKLPF1236B_GA0070989_10068 [Candidatus Kentron sp. LPFa]
MKRVSQQSWDGQSEVYPSYLAFFGSGLTGLVHYLENLRQNDQKISRKYLLLDSCFRGNDGRVVDENLWFRLDRVRCWKKFPKNCPEGVSCSEPLLEAARLFYCCFQSS